MAIGPRSRAREREEPQPAMALTPRDIAGFGGPYPGRLDEEPIDPAALPAVDVDVTTPPDVTRMPDGALTLTDDGGVMDFDPDAPEPPLEGAEAHDANLAEFLAPDALSRLADEKKEEGGGGPHNGGGPGGGGGGQPPPP